MPTRILLRAVAASLVAGEQSVDQVTARVGHTLGASWNWIRPLAERYLRTFAGSTRPRRREVIGFLVHDRGFTRARRKHALRVDHWLTDSPRMLPVPAASSWNLPVVETAAALAEWLSLSVAQLQWFADLKGLGYKSKSPKLRHYSYRILAKPGGNIRLIEAPKSRLRELQRQILAHILEKVPAHAAVHGFVKGRSIKTFTAPHVGQRVVLRMDLQDFFPSFAAARIQTFFRTLGYPEDVADLLGGICTTTTPRDIWPQRMLDVDPNGLWDARQLYTKPHLPQGAPTSPALANLCMYRVDCRLAALARSAGARYTRYADDLAFSGDEEFERRVDRFSTHVAALLLEEGFNVNFRKTRVMRQGVRQRLAGIVVNRRMNIMRPDFDRLKATLNNCLRSGPETQNRQNHPAFRSHLEGRVAFVEMVNPAKGKRLRTILEKVPWQ